MVGFLKGEEVITIFIAMERMTSQFQEVQKCIVEVIKQY